MQFLRGLGRGLKRLGFGVLVVLAGLMIWQAFASWRAFQTPPAGQLVSVGGSRMHVLCTGAPTEPTVVLDAGAGVTLLSWDAVQRAVSGFARTCSFDRPGEGWSDSRPGPRDAVHVAQDLEALLHTVGVTGEVVLAGHSLGGLYARYFAARHPDTVAGLVLVDATPVMTTAAQTSAALAAAFFRAHAITGFRRLTGAGSERGAEGPLLLSFSTAWAVAAEVGEAANTMTQVLEAERVAGSPPLGDRPMIVLRRGKNLRPDWTRAQQEATKLSRIGELRVADESGHEIPRDQPEIVIEAIRDLVAAVR